MGPVPDCTMWKVGQVSKNPLDSHQVSYPGVCLNLDMIMTDLAISRLPSVTAHISCLMRVWYCLVCSSLHSSEMSSSGWSDSSSGDLAFWDLEPKMCSYALRIFSTY